jgi:carboxypeptidase Taq
MPAYHELMAFDRKTQALGKTAERLSWDQETIMPEGADDQRAEERAAIEGILHQRRTDPRVGAWLAALDGADLTEVEQAQVDQIQRSYTRTARIPEDLATELARVASKAQKIWAQARQDNDFKSFAPALENMVALRRQEAQALSEGGDLYDALLENYEPFTKADDLSAMFDALRPGLVRLREAVLAQPAKPGLDFVFDEAKQMQLAHKVAESFGYDFNRGRLDKAVHPFSSGQGNDVRITTRTEARNPFNCLYSTIHEVGHACYEQNVDQAYLLTSLGQGASMGVHESQSRIYENQLGRSRAYTGWLFEQMRDCFGDFGVADAETFYGIVNAVENGFIRTEADELQYNLHVMLRFDLERALLSGDLPVADLESAWSDRFKADFGFEVSSAANGVLQDVHWSLGYIGYFPTYSLGNVYAGCLHQAMRRDLPNLDTDLAQGDTSAATGWLRDNLQVHGSRYAPRDLMIRATGETPSEAPLLSYLEGKFKDLYDL